MLRSILHKISELILVMLTATLRNFFLTWIRLGDSAWQ